MNEKETYDIAIIGLGPAGSTLARLLDKNLSVIAIDKKSDNEAAGFKKPCGGLLAPDAQKALSRFGLTLPLNILVNPQIFSVKTIDLKTKSIRHYQRFYMNMDRHKFDLWLKSLIPNNVEVHNDAICSNIKHDGKYYLITWIENGSKHSIKTRYIVGADGAASIIRHKIYPGKKINTYISIQQWFENKDIKPSYSCIFDPEITDCYAWSVSKNNNFILGGAFKLQNGREKFEQLKEKLKNYNFKLDNPIKTEACLVLRPGGLFQFCCGRNNAFLIGEAAGFISPSSLEGISYALESAYKLSKIFNKNKNKLNIKYWFATLNIQLKLLFKNLKMPFLYNSCLRYFVMKSRFKSITILPEINCK